MTGVDESKVARYGSAQFSRDVIERFPELGEALRSNANLLRLQIETLATAIRSEISAGDTYLAIEICVFLNEMLEDRGASAEMENALAFSFIEPHELRRTAAGRFLLRSMPARVRQILLKHEAEIGEW